MRASRKPSAVPAGVSKAVKRAIFTSEPGDPAWFFVSERRHFFANTLLFARARGSPVISGLDPVPRIVTRSKLIRLEIYGSSSPLFSRRCGQPP